MSKIDRTLDRTDSFRAPSPGREQMQHVWMNRPVLYPVVSDNALVSIEALDRASLIQARMARPMVRAAGILGRDSSTEIIDVNRLSQKTTSVIQYVEVADAEGRLYCVDGLVSTPCWLKIVAIAKDCQSCNVILMSTDKGVVLKAIRTITSGEPLLMWFNENVLAMMNMPFLTPSNIQGQNRYICHVCNNLFEYPNPLKIHLALKCNRLDANHLWSILAKEFSASPRRSLSLSLYPQSTFRFQLSGPPRSSQNRMSPILVEAPESNVLSLTNHSSSSSNQASPPASSSAQISPSSPKHGSPNKEDAAEERQSAFRAYMPEPNVSPDVRVAAVAPVAVVSRRDVLAVNPYVVQPPPPSPPQQQVRADVHAAQMEMIVSNLGKSKHGHLCIYCGKVYSRKYGLKIHIRTHTGYKPLRCRFCLRPFGDPSNLNKHVRLHADGETPYRCDLCGKVLVRKRDLERHIRSRHQENTDNVSDTSNDGDV